MASSINGILSTASSALSAHQRAFQVAAHNISNVNTEGYSRQRIELAAGGLLGTGVRADDVRRIRDALLDNTFRRESSVAGEYRLRHETLGRIEDVFNEPSESGLGRVLSEFWSSWSNLATHPSDSTARTVVRERGRQVADQFNRIATGLDDVRHALEVRLEDSVKEFNQLSAEIAELNGRILSAEAGGTSAPDLRDAQDRLIDRLSEIATVQVHEQGNGTLRILLGGVSVVEGRQSFDLATEYAGGQWKVIRAKTGADVADVQGVLGGAQELLNRDLPAIRQQVDELAGALVEAVNAWHRLGTNPLGESGQDFFQEGASTAGSIRLSDAVADSADAIVAGMGDATGAYQSGADEIALELARFRHVPQAALGGSKSFGDRYAEIVTQVGLEVGAAEDRATIHDALAAHAENRRSSVSDVSIDEEMIGIIQTQTAYSAAARVVTAADEMLRTLLKL